MSISEGCTIAILLNTDTDAHGASSPPPRWVEQLRAQGQSIAWLARELDVSRTYLSAVASGHRHASAELEARISALLNLGAIEGPQRLERVRRDAAARVHWASVRNLARQLADSIEDALRYHSDGTDARGATDGEERR